MTKKNELNNGAAVISTEAPAPITSDTAVLPLFGFSTDTVTGVTVNPLMVATEKKLVDLLPLIGASKAVLDRAKLSAESVWATIGIRMTLDAGFAWGVDAKYAEGVDGYDAEWVKTNSKLVEDACVAAGETPATARKHLQRVRDYSCNYVFEGKDLPNTAANKERIALSADLTDEAFDSVTKKADRTPAGIVRLEKAKNGVQGETETKLSKSEKLEKSLLSHIEGAKLALGKLMAEKNGQTNARLAILSHLNQSVELATPVTEEG